MERFIDRVGLKISEPLVRFLEERALPGTGLSLDQFWQGTAQIFSTLAPANNALLETRDRLQAEIDAWHKARRGQQHDPEAYQNFLRDIGYLVPEPAPFRIGVTNVDDELALVAGPQLVVPILNPRFLLNAANARWGSLYDALYGTDAIAGQASADGYDPARGAKVIARAKAFLDSAVPLASGSHADVTDYQIQNSALSPALADPACF
ncbi:MAG TPA: malate synthase G, partial [Rhizomicrobium sp.]